MLISTWILDITCLGYLPKPYEPFRANSLLEIHTDCEERIVKKEL